MYGDTRHGSDYFQLIKDGASVAARRSGLMFGQITG